MKSRVEMLNDSLVETEHFQKNIGKYLDYLV